MLPPALLLHCFLPAPEKPPLPVRNGVVKSRTWDDLKMYDKNFIQNMQMRMQWCT